MADRDEVAASIDVLAVDEAVQRSSGTDGYGATPDRFLPKPFARLLAEKLALARALFGDDIDLTSASALRKIFEVQALEDARGWSMLAAFADDANIATAKREALSRHGDDLGLSRPFLHAAGTVTLVLDGDLPAGVAAVTLPRGARMLSQDRLRHAALDEAVVLTAAAPRRSARVVAFHPGPEHNLDPTAAAPDGSFPQRLALWNRDDAKLAPLELADGTRLYDLVTITHDQKLAGGEFQWPDRRYRQLLLQAPRSIWTVDAVRVAASLVPGVRRVLVRDLRGGLDLAQSIFGNFAFIERVFSAERDLASPYYFQVLVAPTPGAFWEGPDGLYAAVMSAMEDVRPIGIFPEIVQARQVAVKVSARLVVKGLPLPSGSTAAVNASDVAQQLRRRLLDRLRPVVEETEFGDPVRAAEVTWSLMNEPGIVDVRDLVLSRFPPRAGAPGASFAGGVPPSLEPLACGENVALEPDQVAVLVDQADGLEII